MGIMLAFAPFIVFAVVAGMSGASAGLLAGAAVSVGLLVRDWMRGNRSLKMLEVGTPILFVVLAIYAGVTGPGWPLPLVRLFVDTGLLVIVLVSMAVRRPFTLQYAREQAPPEVWENPVFIRTNYIITAVWALAFVAMVLADLAVLYLPGFPSGGNTAVTVGALVAAGRFTTWYPGHVRAQAAR